MDRIQNDNFIRKFLPYRSSFSGDDLALLFSFKIMNKNSMKLNVFQST